MTGDVFLSFLRCGMPDCSEGTVYVLESHETALPLCANHAALIAGAYGGLVPVAAFLPEAGKVTR